MPSDASQGPPKALRRQSPGWRARADAHRHGARMAAAVAPTQYLRCCRLRCSAATPLCQQTRHPLHPRC